MPLEGTGYLKLLDEGPRYESPAATGHRSSRTSRGPTSPRPPPIDRGPFSPVDAPASATPRPVTIPPNAQPGQPRSGRIAIEFRDGNGRDVADFC